MIRPKTGLFVATTLGFCFLIQAQEYIGLSRFDCMKAASSLGKNVKVLKPVSHHMDPTPPDTLCVTGFTGPAAPGRLHLKFDTTRVCILEIWLFNGESDHNAYLQQVLGDPKWGWKKLNENQYISDFVHQRTLEIPPENPNWQFSIIRSAWTRTLYDLLTQ